MHSGSYRFDNFSLKPADRQLKRDNVPLELNARYFDALALLVRENGKLISKDRFLEEVWRGIPVTDEALTQCIRTIRKQLGDNAGHPRFIETVPKHGYRFITPVAWIDDVTVAHAAPAGSATLMEADAFAASMAANPGHSSIAAIPTDASPASIAANPAHSSIAAIPADASLAAPSANMHAALANAASPPHYSWQQFFVLGGAGTAGGAIAGVVGGLFFGLAGVSLPLQSGMGAISVLLVFFCLSILLGLLGGAGVSFGIAAAAFAPGRIWQWSMAGGALGGMVVGAIVKMLGLDAFNLLFGQSPGDITGALEGALLGAAVGSGLWFGRLETGPAALKRSILAATSVGAVAGLVIPLLGGRLMGGSLDLLARNFPGSRLKLDHIGRLFGEDHFGLLTQMATGAIEAAVFCGCIVGTILVARWRLRGAVS